jgi:hypothetical protein
MPTKKTTRIPPRTRPPRRRLPSPLARPSHERVQFSESFPRTRQKLFFYPVVSRNGDTHLDKTVPTRLFLCVTGYCTTTYLFLLMRLFLFLLFWLLPRCLFVSSHHCTARVQPRLLPTFAFYFHTRICSSCTLVLRFDLLPPFYSFSSHYAFALWTGKRD